MANIYLRTKFHANIFVGDGNRPTTSDSRDLRHIAGLRGVASRQWRDFLEGKSYRFNKDNMEQGQGGRREVSGRGAWPLTFSQSIHGCLFCLVPSRSNAGQTSGLSKKTPPSVKPRKPQSSRESAARFSVTDDSSTDALRDNSYPLNATKRAPCSRLRKDKGELLCRLPDW